MSARISRTAAIGAIATAAVVGATSPVWAGSVMTPIPQLPAIAARPLVTHSSPRVSRLEAELAKTEAKLQATQAQLRREQTVAAQAKAVARSAITAEQQAKATAAKRAVRVDRWRDKARDRRNLTAVAGSAVRSDSTSHGPCAHHWSDPANWRSDPHAAHGPCHHH